MTRSHPHRSRTGFTLIELLVVMGIIILLAGIAIPTILKVRTTAKESATRTTLQQIRLAMESYSGEFGDYPPTTLRDLGLNTNKVNDGIESLVACLVTGRVDGPYYEFPEDRLSNLDNDKVPDFNQSTIPSGMAFEFTDEWGNPFIYFHNRDYESPEVANKYLFPGSPKKVTVTPAKSEKTGSWFGLTSYQMWSVGPNGRNENGGGDDIPSWKAN